MAKCAKGNKQDNEECSRSTNLPKVDFCLDCINNACQIHSVVRREEGQRQEDNSYAGEDQNSLVLGVRNNGQFVLLDRTELKELLKTECPDLVNRKGGEHTAFIDCLVSIKSRSKQSNCALTIPIAHSTRSCELSPLG